MISMLLSAGADPNIQNDAGETPVHYAAKRGIPSVFHVLIKYGGDVTTIDNRGRKMTHHAAEMGSALVFVFFQISFSLNPSSLLPTLYVIPSISLSVYLSISFSPAPSIHFLISFYHLLCHHLAC